MIKIDKTNELYGKAYVSINLRYIDEQCVSEYYNYCNKHNINNIQINDEVIIDPIGFLYQTVTKGYIDSYFDNRDIPITPGRFDMLNKEEKYNSDYWPTLSESKTIMFTTNGFLRGCTDFVNGKGLVTGEASNRFGKNTTKNIIELEDDDINPYLTSYLLDNMEETDKSVEDVVNYLINL